MDDSSTTADTLDQAGEEILTHTVSDEALEAAAGTQNQDFGATGFVSFCVYATYCYAC